MESMTLIDEAKRLVAEIRAQGEEIPERDEHIANVLEGLTSFAAQPLRWATGVDAAEGSPNRSYIMTQARAALQEAYR